MDDIRYDRICRTSKSEAYLVSRGEEPVARVELHFAHTMVYGLLVVEKDFDDQQITDLIETIDSDLVWSVGIRREDFVVTVYRGQQVGVYGDSQAEEGDGEEADESV